MQTKLNTYNNTKKTSFDLILVSIVLEDSVWIAAKSTVCPDVICTSNNVLVVSIHD